MLHMYFNIFTSGINTAYDNKNVTQKPAFNIPPQNNEISVFLKPDLLKFKASCNWYKNYVDICLLSFQHYEQEITSSSSSQVKSLSSKPSTRKPRPRLPRC